MNEREMTVRARYVHTNLIAEDWENLVAIYRAVFGCAPATDEERLTGDWLQRIAGVDKAEIRVIHLRLPGHGEDGPTLEIIRYRDQEARRPAAANRPGFGHIAFAVGDVEAARNAVVAAGGRAIGEVVRVEIPGRGELTETYVADPEDNIIELQRWSRCSSNFGDSALNSRLNSARNN
jgi:predicted enzyme related to lactoylglutathione lyase